MTTFSNLQSDPSHTIRSPLVIELPLCIFAIAVNFSFSLNAAYFDSPSRIQQISSSFIMNPEIMIPLVASRYIKKEEDRSLSVDRKRTQVSSGTMATAKKPKLQAVLENAELQITSNSLYYNKIEEHREEGINHESNWVYDQSEDLDFHPSDFLRQMDAMRTLSQPTGETSLLRQIKQCIILLTINRILKIEKCSIAQSRSSVKSKFLMFITTNINPSIKKSAIRYITDKIKTRLDLGLEWLSKEYAIFRSLHDDKPEDENQISYKILFCMLTTAICETKEEDREPLMTKLYLEAPEVPDKAIECWKNIIPDERGLVVIELLRNIIMKRPEKLRKFINVLLQFSKHEISIIRKRAVEISMNFYENPTFTKMIADFAFLHIQYLRLEAPPSELFSKDQGREKQETQWTSSTVRACLALYMGLVEKYPHFIQELERMFTSFHPKVQKMILKYIRIPLKVFNIATSLLDV